MYELPYAGRTLHFIRHGQYESGEAGSKRLTPLGRKQALRLARYFEKHPVDRIFSSDLVRARETADILAEHLAVESVRRYRALREVLPTKVKGMRIPLEKRLDGARRVDRTLELFFESARPSRHLVVCHGNLIRALVMKVTTGKLLGWDRLVMHHCGITTFLVREESTLLLGFNAQEHLPHALRSL